MQTLQLIKLGELSIANPRPGEPAFLSAASGAAWIGNQFWVVGDDQAEVGQFELRGSPVMEALRLGENTDILQPGIAEPILPGGLPKDESARKEAKADFEALTIITRKQLESLPPGMVRDISLRRFSDGMMIIAGSGGLSWGGERRSIGVIYKLDQNGHVTGLPARISLEGLHTYLEKQIGGGELNIEGVTVHRDYLVLAQRGNSIDKQTKRPAKNMLFYLSLEEFLQSIFTDLKVDERELRSAREYELGTLPLAHKGEQYDAKLDFTDIDSVTGDPFHRMVFTAAAEGPDDTPIRGMIAGSIVGVVDRYGRIAKVFQIEDPSTKLEGVNARYNVNTDTIDLLVVPDADNPNIPAPLFAARIAA